MFLSVPPRLQDDQNFAGGALALRVETEKMQKSDPVAKDLVAKFRVPMPNPGLKSAEVRDLLKFFHWSDQREGIAKN